MKDITDLMKRVEEATVRLDDETLGRVLCALQDLPFGKVSIGCGDDGTDELRVYAAGGAEVETFAPGGYRHLAPDVNVSATIALAERVLPGWWPRVECFGEWWEASVSNDDGRFLVAGDRERYATAPNPALALVLAVLKATHCQSEEGA